MIEYILDLLFDFIVEGSVELTTAKKVPMPLRILAFIVVILIYLGVSGLFFYLGYFEAEPTGSFLCYVAGLIILIAGIYQIFKLFKKRKEE